MKLEETVPIDSVGNVSEKEDENVSLGEEGEIETDSSESEKVLEGKLFVIVLEGVSPPRITKNVVVGYCV